MSEPTQAALPASYVLSFDYRSDNGPRLVGPFESRDAAFAYAATIGGTLEYEAVPLAAPGDAS